MAAELVGLGDAFECTAQQAAGAHAHAEVALARSDGPAALTAARRAVQLWGELDARYDIARAWVVLGRALTVVGDDASAEAEWRAARALFADAGASTAHGSMVVIGDEVAGGLSPREVEVVRLVAVGHTNSQIAADLVLAEKTVARHLSNIYTKFGVHSRTAAAAFAHEHGLT